MAGGAEARARVVARADLRVAQATVSWRRGHARVPRDHLSEPLRTDAWCAQEGAHGALTHGTAIATSPRRQHVARRGATGRHGVDPRTPGRGRRSRRAGSLGG